MAEGAGMVNQFAVFIRGINISGRNKVSMPQLKNVLEEAGFCNVRTLLNSGNIVLQSEKSVLEIREEIQHLLEEKFCVSVPVYCISGGELKSLLENAPAWWGTDGKAAYHNLIFILTEETPEQIASVVGEPSAELERIESGDKVIYWSFDRANYQKCAWWKRTASEGIAEKLTIRTAGTVMKAVSAL